MQFKNQVEKGITFCEWRKPNNGNLLPRLLINELFWRSLSIFFTKIKIKNKSFFDDKDYCEKSWLSNEKKALAIICLDISSELYHAQPIRLEEIITFFFFLFS
jgi:hypothetical protein